MPEIINSYQYAGLPAAKSNKNPNFVNLSQQHQHNHVATKKHIVCNLIKIGDDYV